MANLQYHKGQNCVYNAILCQEGYCSECEIGLNRTLNTEAILREDSQPVYKEMTAGELQLVSARR